MSGYRGIVILSFGKVIYGKLAFNLAMSIKYHSPNIPIHLICEASSLDHLDESHKRHFDKITEIKPDDLYDADGTMNPAKAKVRVIKYNDFDECIYLDTDAVCLKPVEPLFDELAKKGKPFYTQVYGVYEKGKPFPEMVWAKPEDVIKHYSIPHDLPATNTSFFYFQGTASARVIFQIWEDNILEYPLPNKLLLSKWGGTYPDELALNITCAETGYNPNAGFNPVYLSQQRIESQEQVEQDHYFLGTYGAINFSHHSLHEWYDRLIHKYSMDMQGCNIEFKSLHLVAHKHANNKAPQIRSIGK